MKRDPYKDPKTNWKRVGLLISADDVATEVDGEPVDSIDSTDLTCEKSSDVTTAVDVVNKDVDRTLNWRIPKWMTMKTRPPKSLKTWATIGNRLMAVTACRANQRHPSPWP